MISRLRLALRLQWLVLCFTVASVSLLAPCFASADERNDQPLKLGDVFVDDFAADSRDKYDLQGDVAWQSKRLKLIEGSSLQRTFSGGPWVETRIALDGDQEDSTTAREFRVWLSFREASDCCVRIREATDQGQRKVLVALIETKEEDGKRVETPIREQSIDAARLDSLTVHYRNGVTTVSSGDKELLNAYIDIDEPVDSCRLESVAKTHALTSWSVRASKRSSELTETEKKLFLTAMAANKEFVESYRAGKLDAALAKAKEISETMREAVGERHAQYANSLDNLSVMQIEKKQYAEAETTLRKSLQLKRELLGESHPNYAFSLNNVATLLERTNKRNEAKALFTQALAIREKMLGPDSFLALKARSNLARLHQGLGQHQEAKSLREVHVQLTAAKYGEDSKEYAESVSGLGILCLKLNEVERAQAYFEQALEIRKKLVGTNHTDYAVSLYNLGFLHNEVGNTELSEPLLQESLALYKSLRGERSSQFARGLVALASLYFNSEQFDKAEAYYRRALPILWATGGGASHEFGVSLANLGELLRSQRNDFANAEPLLRKALTVLKTVAGENHPEYISTLCGYGRLRADMADYDTALKIFAKAESLRGPEWKADKQEYAEHLSEVGRILNAKGDFAKGERLLQQAMKLYESAPDENRDAYAKCLCDLADLYLEHREQERAQEFVERAVEITRETHGESHFSHLAMLVELARVRAGGAGSEATQQYCRNLLVRVEAKLGKEHPLTIDSLINLAAAYASDGQYAKAESSLAKALRRQETSTGKDLLYAHTLGTLADIYSDMGDFARAEPAFVETVALKKSILGDQHPHYATTLNAFGLMSYHMGGQRLERAKALFREALTIQRSVFDGDHIDCATTLNNLAGVHRLQRDFEQAAKLHEESLTIVGNTFGEDHLYYAIGLSNLGLVYVEMQDFERGAEAYERSLELLKTTVGIHHPIYAGTLRNSADVKFRQGDPDSAVQLLREATRIRRENLANDSLYQSARQQIQSQIKARLFVDRLLATAIQSEVDAEPVVSELWRWKGAVTAKQKAYRQVASHPELAPVFAKLQQTALQLSGLLAQAPSAPRNASAEQLADFANARQAWRARFRELTRQQEELEQKIAQSSSAFQTAMNPPSIADVGQWLGEGVAFVDFLEYQHYEKDPSNKLPFRFERRFVAVVVRAGQEPKIVPLPSADVIATAVNDFRRQFVVGPERESRRLFAKPAGRLLRQELWEPIERHLSGVNTVVISPDTCLGMCPFAALPGRKANGFLLEDYRLAMTPSVYQLRPSELAQSDPNDGFLMVGDIHYAGKPARQQTRSAASTESTPPSRRVTWNSLPGFSAELEALEKLYGQERPDEELRILRGDEADEINFLREAQRAKTLHVVTHGFFESANVRSIKQASLKNDSRLATESERRGPDPFVNAWMPGLLSGLVLTGANNAVSESELGQDGILRASEIESSSLQGVDLVVLSACETGLGAVAGGEGLTGLQRAFHLAGAETVVASLWKVDDAATLALMSEFYRNLWEKDLSKLDALREAQLLMLKNFDAESGTIRGLGGKSVQVVASTPKPDSKPTSGDPRYWAAFQLSGDWR